MNRAPGTTIPLSADDLGRLWVLRCRSELGLHKNLVDPSTGRLRPPYDRIFAHLLHMAAQQGRSPRDYLDDLITGVKRIRTRIPDFVPCTSRLLDRQYRKLLLTRYQHR